MEHTEHVIIQSSTLAAEGLREVKKRGHFPAERFRVDWRVEGWGDSFNTYPKAKKEKQAMTCDITLRPHCRFVNQSQHFWGTNSRVHGHFVKTSGLCVKEGIDGEFCHSHSCWRYKFLTQQRSQLVRTITPSWHYLPRNCMHSLPTAHRPQPHT